MKKITLGIIIFSLIFTSCYITSQNAMNENNNNINNQPSGELSTAGKNKQRLLNYLQSEVWEKKTLSGQMDLTWDDSIDMLNKVYSSTGKYPAISGYDFMNIGL